MDRMQITADLYEIDIKNRILESGFIYNTITPNGAPGPIQLYQPGPTSTPVNPGTTPPVAAGPAIAAKGVTLDSGLSYTGISLFANAANTKTQGAEITLNYASDFDEFGHVDWTLGFNYNETTLERVKDLPFSEQVNQNVPAYGANPAYVFTQKSFLSKNASSALTTANPKEKLILQANWSLDKFSINLRESIYGPSAQWSANNALYDKINTTGITDIDVGYKFSKQLKFDVGANNLFDTIPGHDPGVSGGGRVYKVPYAFSPYGTNGGYYYGRFTYNF
jgi:iron complex outermembrane receptor protein